MSAPLLSLGSVSKTFTIGNREIVAVDKVSLEIKEGECLAIVGESGSGKSTLANLILGIYPASSGTISLRGEALPANRTLAHRRAIQLVQQNPLSSLNPKRSIGASLRLPLDVHGVGERAGRWKRVEALLEEVHLPADYRRRSPAALSGGQRQRVAIARALASESELVVLDEPTSALDVLVQARILKLLNELQRRRRLTFVFITHDLSVVRNIADRVAVFEKGRLVEQAPVETIFTNPSAGYTRSLIAAVPVITRDEQALKDSLTKTKEE